MEPKRKPPAPPAIIPYEDFRTGLDYTTVRQWLWSGSDDRRDWPEASRGVVLGLWGALKREMYAAYLNAATAPPAAPCEASCFCPRCRDPKPEE